MTKFEEEVKRPDNTGIEPFSKRDVDFSKLAAKFARAAQTLKKWREYAGFKEKQLEKKDEQIRDLKSQLQQQPLPVVPECVGEWIESEDLADLIDIWYNRTNELPEEVREYFDSLDDDIISINHLFKNTTNLIARAKLDGYQVEKPQLFYLKHIDMSKQDKEYDYFAQIRNDRFEHDSVKSNTLPGVEVIGVRFTQQEIDSMETGSYEQIEVAE